MVALPDPSKRAISHFADFIRPATSEQKMRVYREVLAETAKQQCQLMMEAKSNSD